MRQCQTTHAFLFSLMLTCTLGLIACGDNNTGQSNNNNSTQDMAPDTMNDMSMVDTSPDMEIAREDSVVQGRAVKGPFQRGSILTIYELDEKGQRTDQQIKGQIDEEGYFLVASMPFTSWIEIEVKGRYFDETTGRLSEDKRTLSTLAFVENGRVTGNINLFTSFMINRVRKLIEGGSAVDVEGARRLARQDFGGVFYINNYPEALHILNINSTGLSLDNMILLWFSASLLDAQVTQQEYESLVTDFADDGRINEAGRPIFERVQSKASNDLYASAREKLLKVYDKAPPEQWNGLWPVRWTYYNCFNREGVASFSVCTGANDSLPGMEADPENEGRFTRTVTFVPPESGTYILRGRFDDFGSRNDWSLRSPDNSIVAKSRSLVDTIDDTSNLEPGLPYDLIFYTYTDANPPATGEYAIEIVKSSDGSRKEPHPLMHQVPHEGYFGTTADNVGDSYQSFYVFYLGTANKDTVNINVTDLPTDNDAIVEVYGADASNAASSEDAFFDQARLLERKEGKNAISVNIQSQSDLALYIVVQNAEPHEAFSREQPERFSYKIEVN